MSEDDDVQEVAITPSKKYFISIFIFNSFIILSYYLVEVQRDFWQKRQLLSKYSIFLKPCSYQLFTVSRKVQKNAKLLGRRVRFPKPQAQLLIIGMNFFILFVINLTEIIF